MPVVGLEVDRLQFVFAIAFPSAFLANRYLPAGGKGHPLVHRYHQHEKDDECSRPRP